MTYAMLSLGKSVSGLIVGKNGGIRPGAGRKPGSPNTKTRELALRAAEKGVTPIEVMLANMRYYFEQAHSMSEAERGLETQLRDTGADAGEIADALRGLRACADKARRAAQESAKDAAPYIHPRLQAIELSGDKDKPLTVELVRFSGSDAGAATQPVGAEVVPAQSVGLPGAWGQESGAGSAPPMGKG